MDGLLILNLINGNWNNVNNGLFDKAIWDLAINNHSLYIATARGINEMSIITNTILPKDQNLIKLFINKEIYKILFVNNILYVSSEMGLSYINFKTKINEHLSSKLIKDFEIYNNRIFINDDKIWELTNNNGNYIEKLIYHQGNNFCVSDNYIWIKNRNNALLIDTNNGAEWIYTDKDGIPGNIINEIGCDKEWVWLGTNNGVVYYNWKVYH